MTYRVQGQEVMNTFQSRLDVFDWVMDSLAICKSAAIRQAQKDGWPDLRGFDLEYSFHKHKWDIAIEMKATPPRSEP